MGARDYSDRFIVAENADIVIDVSVQSGFSRSNLHTADDMDDAAEILQEISEAGDSVLFESRIPAYEEE